MSAIPAVALDRTVPPAAGPPEGYEFPAIDRRCLASGIELIAVPLAGTPLAAVEILFPAGGEADPVDRSGLATLVADLLDEGTEERSAVEIAAAVERLGASLQAGADWDSAQLGLRILSEHLDEGLGLLAELATRPSFPEAEVERVRRHRLTDLVRRRDQPAAVASDHLQRLIYGDHVYGRSLVGTPASVSALDRDDVVGFYRRRYAVGAPTVIAAGDLAPERLAAAVERLLPAPSGVPNRDPPPAAPSHQGGLRVRIVDRPGAAQTELRLGHLGLPRLHPDWTTLSVANTLLGGKFTSRINLNLRERHGYSYGAFSRFVGRLGPGPFVVSAAVDSAAAAAAAREILVEIRRLRDEPPGADELAETQSYLRGIFPFTLQTVAGVLQRIESLAVYGLPDDYFTRERYVERLERVDRAEVQRVSQAYLDPESMAIVAVGPAAELARRFEALFAGPGPERAAIEIVADHG